MAGSPAHEFSYAFRLPRRERACTAVALLTVAIAIEANSVIFSLANAVLFRPLPFPDPDRLVFLWERIQGSREFASDFS